MPAIGIRPELSIQVQPHPLASHKNYKGPEYSLCGQHCPFLYVSAARHFSCSLFDSGLQIFGLPEPRMNESVAGVRCERCLKAEDPNGG
jgi:hypothetical protein